MRPSCFKPAFDIGKLLKPLQDPVMSHCRTSVSLIDTHLLPVRRMAADRSIHRPFLLPDHSVDDGTISADNRMLLQLCSHQSVSRVILTCDQYSCGIHIDPMDDPRPENSVDARQLTPAVVHKAVDQRSAVMACGRMNHHAFRLVDEDHILVFIKDIQLHRFRHDFRLCCLRNIDADSVFSLHLIAGSDSVSVDHDCLSLQKFLDIRPGQIFTGPGQKYVDSGTGLLVRYTKRLIHACPFLPGNRISTSSSL